MAGTGAPYKKGLDYFPKMVNFYEDDKIFDLLEAKGPLGVTVYDCILTIVYSQGYYAEISKEKLARMVVKKIGDRWVKKEVAVQVIDLCADLGLLANDLLQHGIITSVGIQKRYYTVAVKLMKRQLYSTEYWLLDEKGQPVLNAPFNPDSSEESRLTSEESQDTSEKQGTKERKEKKGNKGKEIPSGGTPSGADGEQPAVILLPLKDGTEYMVFPKQVAEWTELYPTVDILQELKKMRGWLTANPTRQKTPGGVLRFITGWLAREQGGAAPKMESASKQEPPANRFNDFPQRDYDFDEIERQFRIN